MNIKQNYVFTIDGGGTHTECKVFKILDFNELQEIDCLSNLNGCNYYTFGIQGLKDVLLSLKDYTTQKSLKPEQIFFIAGCSGYESDELIEEAKKLISADGYQNIYFVCDSDLALSALGEGLFGILGSGSAYLGRFNNQKKVYGGMGLKENQYGAASNIGISLACIATEVIEFGFFLDKNFEKTFINIDNSPLLARLIKEIDLFNPKNIKNQREKLIEFLHPKDVTVFRNEVSLMAPLVFDAAEEKDLLALYVLSLEKDGIVRSLSYLAQFFGVTKTTLGLMGGVLNHQYIKNSFIPEIVGEMNKLGYQLDPVIFGKQKGERDLLLEATRKIINT